MRQQVKNYLAKHNIKHGENKAGVYIHLCSIYNPVFEYGASIKMDLVDCEELDHIPQDVYQTINSYIENGLLNLIDCDHCGHCG